jgi:hypothetical protein
MDMWDALGGFIAEQGICPLVEQARGGIRHLGKEDADPVRVVEQP